MASNFRIPSKNNVISSNDVPTTGAGSKAGDPLRDGGVNAVNLWGTGGGIGVPEDRAMLALDGVVVYAVNVVAAIEENDPIYITSANALTTASSGNTLFGFADEAADIGTAQVIGVRISNAIGA